MKLQSGHGLIMLPQDVGCDENIIIKDGVENKAIGEPPTY